MSLYYVTPSDDYLSHSAKGTTWKKHKYIRKENGRYIYPSTNSNNKNNTLTDSPMSRNTPYKTKQAEERYRLAAAWDAYQNKYLTYVDDSATKKAATAKMEKRKAEYESEQRREAASLEKAREWNSKSDLEKTVSKITEKVSSTVSETAIKGQRAIENTLQKLGKMFKK